MVRDYPMRNIDKLLMGDPMPRVPKARPPDGEVGHCQLCSFDALMNLFEANGIDRIRVDDIDARGEYTLAFSVDGPRDSVIFYTLSATAWMEAWFGKNNSDSGGMQLSGRIPDKPENVDEQALRLIRLHKRFMASGRRKIIANYRANRRRGR